MTDADAEIEALAAALIRYQERLERQMQLKEDLKYVRRKRTMEAFDTVKDSQEAEDDMETETLG